METFVREYLKDIQGTNSLNLLDQSFRETLSVGDSVRFTKANLKKVADGVVKHVYLRIENKNGNVSYQQLTSPLSQEVLGALKAGKSPKDIIPGLLSLPMLVGEIEITNSKGEKEKVKANYISRPQGEVAAFSLESLVAMESSAMKFQPSDLVAF